MELKNLNTFMIVAEQNSFTKAAKILGYSQSTISFQIKQLEDEIGIPLFERIYHTLTLTEQGHKLLHTAHAINQKLDVYLQDINHNNSISGHVRLALADSLCVALVDKVFPDLHHNHPNITLFCDTAGTDDLLVRLNQNEADLVYVMDAPVHNTNYKTIQSEKVCTYFVCSPNHPLANTSHVSIEQLIEQPFLLTEKGMSYRRIFDEELAKKGLEVNPVFVSGDTYLICDLVAKDCGISLLPAYACQEMIDCGKVCKLKVDSALNPVVYAQLLVHRDKWISNALQTVIDCLCAYKL